MKKIVAYKCIFVFIVLLTACGTSLGDYQAKNDQEKEIKNVLLEFTRARNNFDTQKIASFLTDDCKINFPGHSTLVSKAEYVSTWKDSDIETVGKCKFINLELSIQDEFVEAKTDCSQSIITPNIIFNFKMVRHFC
jgi:hypothetical protein